MSSEKTKSDIHLKEKLTLSDDFTPPSFDEWKDKVVKDLKGKPYEKLISNTIDGIQLQPIYTKADTDGKDIQQFPIEGSYRGTSANGYYGKDWLINQRIELADVDEYNTALKDALQRGQNSIYISVDKATKFGLDADYAKTEDVGKGGLSISGLSSFSRLLTDIDITKYPIFISTGFSSVPITSILYAYCKNNNIDITKVHGSVEADPIGYWASEGELPVPVVSAISGLKNSMDWKIKNAPSLKTINVSTIPYINGGANAVQELAYAVATSAEYIRNLLDSGADINDVAQNMKITMSAGSSFFTEVSKFRAVKLLWKNLIAAFGGNEKSQKVCLFVSTSQFNKTLFDPYVNMLRTTTESFSAIVGGIDSLQVFPFDSVFSLSDDFSRRIARNTQIILKEESHFNSPIDPAGGSYYVENLTEELAKNAWGKFQEIEKNGGMIESLKKGLIQEEVEKTYQKRLKAISKRKSVIVGTNMYANPTEALLEGKTVNHKALQEKRAEYLQKFRVEKNQTVNEKILTALGTLSKECNEESIDIAADAILNGATLGEVTNSCRVNVSDIEKTNITPILKHRAAEPFEDLRLQADKIKSETGEKPKVLLAPIGSLKEYKARADFSRNFFEVGGFDVVYPNGFNTIEEAVGNTIDENCKTVVICSTDDKYTEIVPTFCEQLKKKKNDIAIVLAGYPKDKVEDYKSNGIDEFIFLGADAYTILNKLISN
ncbi:MAG: methylmalonyl-CoA mutase family protein [Bacteroidota bacterium]